MQRQQSSNLHKPGNELERQQHYQGLHAEHKNQPFMTFQPRLLCSIEAEYDVSSKVVVKDPSGSAHAGRQACQPSVSYLSSLLWQPHPGCSCRSPGSLLHLMKDE